MKSVFITVTDRDFFPGTLATVNSVIHFHPETPIYVVHNEKNPLTAAQIELLSRPRNVVVRSSDAFARPHRYINAWELKAHAACDLAAGFDVVVGIDSDCLLCSPVDDEIRQAQQTGKFLGGRDGKGVDYGPDYSGYGIPTPARNPTYMSTSLYFVAATAENRDILFRWSECCNTAVFNGRGPFPGHGDQGVLNAVLFAARQSQNVLLLPNELWSQHWLFWDTIIRFDGSVFVNESAGNRRQRAFHCGGAEKFWKRDHRERATRNGLTPPWPYLWFLTIFWFGACAERDRLAEICSSVEHEHLVGDSKAFRSQLLDLFRATDRFARKGTATVSEEGEQSPLAV